MTPSFESSYRECYPKVLAYIRRRTEDAVAEDLCAEAFTRAWSGWPPRRKQALPWLYGIARNVVLEHYRGRSHTLPLESVAPEYVREPSAEDHATASADLSRALSQLSQADREILTLHAWEGLSPSDIGAALGITANSARVRLHRSRTRLADLMKESANTTGAIP